MRTRNRSVARSGLRQGLGARRTLTTSGTTWSLLETGDHVASDVTQQLEEQLRNDFVAMAGSLTDQGAIEAYRRYQTEVRFKTSIDTLVAVALDAVVKVAVTLDVSVEEAAIDLFHDHDHDHADPPLEADQDSLRAAFDEGVLGL